VITVAFFNNKGGVGKTTLVYHLGAMYRSLGKRVLLADLDPQANLTAYCLDDIFIEELWANEDKERKTVYGAVFPIQEEEGDFLSPGIVDVLGDPDQLSILPSTPQFGLLAGDLRLATFESKLHDAWLRCLDHSAPAFRATTAFYRLIQESGSEMEADLALIDVGPNLGAVNRSALIAADWIVLPIGADLFSIQALRNVGATLRTWKKEWRARCEREPVLPFELPKGELRTAGYVVMQPHLYKGSLTKAYSRWLELMPQEYSRSILQQKDQQKDGAGGAQLGIIRHYHSLMPLAQRAHKPIFELTPAHGVLGGHAAIAQGAGTDFRALAKALAAKIGLDLAPASRSPSN